MGATCFTLSLAESLPHWHCCSSAATPAGFRNELLCFLLLVEKKREAHYSWVYMHLLVSTLRICSVHIIYSVLFCATLNRRRNTLVGSWKLIQANRKVACWGLVYSSVEQFSVSLLNLMFYGKIKWVTLSQDLSVLLWHKRWEYWAHMVIVFAALHSD